jgi:hypothetical protein
MRIFLRVIAILVIVIASLLMVLNLAQVVGLWYYNGQTKTVLTGALTAGDHLLLNADDFLDEADGTLGRVVALGTELDAELENADRGAGLVHGAQDLATQVVGVTDGLRTQLASVRANASSTEQGIAHLIPRVPTYVNLTWAGATALLLWRVMANLAVIYLAVILFRTGSLRFGASPS